MKPDLLITWHESCDYPIARMFIKRYRDFFGRIIVYLSKHFREPIYAEFLKQSMKDLDILFLDPIEYKYGVEDWRNISTNYMLKHSNSEWVCSIEQDWFCQDWPRLLEECKYRMKTSAGLFGWYSQTANSYVHPAFWFVRRELLEKTGKDFLPHSEIKGSDHFAMITYKVKELGELVVGLRVGEVNPKSLAFHLGGVNQNYLEGMKPEYVFHRPEIFYVYNYFCRKASVIQSPLFADISLKIEEKLRAMFPDLNPETSPWGKFFI